MLEAVAWGDHEAADDVAADRRLGGRGRRRRVHRVSRSAALPGVGLRVRLDLARVHRAGADRRRAGRCPSGSRSASAWPEPPSASAMRPPGGSIAANTSLSEALDHYLRPYPDRAFPVVEDGRVIGVVSMTTARRTGSPRSAAAGARRDAAAEPGGGPVAGRGRSRTRGSGSAAATGSCCRTGSSSGCSGPPTSTSWARGERRRRWRCRRGPTCSATGHRVSAAAGSIRTWRPRLSPPTLPRRRSCPIGTGRCSSWEVRAPGRPRCCSSGSRGCSRTGPSPIGRCWSPGRGGPATPRVPRCWSGSPSPRPGPQIVTAHGLAHRVLKEREGEPPEVLGAAEQFAKVQRAAGGAGPRRRGPPTGGCSALRGFADQVRQLLARMQESLWTPDRIDEAAERAGPARVARARAVRARVPGRARYGQPG